MKKQNNSNPSFHDSSHPALSQELTIETKAAPKHTDKFGLIRRFYVVRFLILTLLLTPFTAFFIQPYYTMHIGFHGQEQSGTLTTYKTDNSVYFKYPSAFRIEPGNTGATVYGFHEETQDLQMIFAGIRTIYLDEIRFSFMMIPMRTLSGQELYDQIESLGGASGKYEDGSVRLDISTTTATIRFKPLRYFGPLTWCVYILTCIVFTYLALVLVRLVLILLSLSESKSAFFEKHRPFSRFLTYLQNVRLSQWLFISAPAAILIVGEIVLESLAANNFVPLLLNYLFMMSLILVLRALTSKTASTVISTVIFTLIYTANHFVSLFRGRPILPWDLKALSTAAAVAGEYTYSINLRLGLLFATAALIIILAVALALKEPKRPKRSVKKCLLLRALVAVCGISIAVLTWISPAFQSLKTDSWDVYIVQDYQQQGFTATFLKFYESYQIKKPEGYKHSVLEEIYEQNSGENALDANKDLSGTKPAKILMIMEESMSELSYARSDIGSDPLSFFNSLSENTIRGNLYVSVRGGGTCNTEFEALTGNSMAFLPANTYPYTGYISRNTYSLATYFAQNGYKTAALHLNAAQNWNRSNVYPHLGLIPFYSQENFKAFSTLRGYATDAVNFSKLEQIDTSLGNDKEFIFNVTMQNHGGYTPTNDLEITTDLSSLENGMLDLTKLEVYDSVLKLTDQDIKDLIEYYQNDEEDVMLVIFGDHQPTLGKDIDDFLLGSDGNLLEKYKTPFVIWTNYDIEEHTFDAISANFLPYLILDTANYPLTPYWSLVGRVFSEYPVITSYGVVDRDGNYYVSVEEVPDEQKLLFDYRCAQYNNLFDDDRLDELFDPQADQEEED